MDLGTGDGRAALAAATARPADLIIGIDANAAGMAEVSRRAARTRGGTPAVPNLLFVVASAEAPPAELCDRADEVRVLFPWGSLLRGSLGVDDAAARGMAGLATAGGRVSVTTSVTERDGLDDLAALDEAAIDAIGRRQRRHGLELVGVQTLDRAEVRATGSSWGRRLTATADRPVRRLDFVRCRPEGEPAV